MVRTHCGDEAPNEWDLEALLTDVKGLWPTEIEVSDIAGTGTTDELYEALMVDATAVYAAREEEIGSEAMREIERQVMLRILDTKWREHLYDMDYLKEGIHLRAMGQRDPLTEWQREGFEMFSGMMDAAAREFVTYVMHVQVKVQDEPADTATGVVESGPTDPSDGSALQSGGAAGTSGSAAAQQQAQARRQQAQDQAVSSGTAAAPKTVEANQSGPQTPVVKSDEEKTPRNAPCPCGSGKKYKQCHGR